MTIQDQELANLIDITTMIVDHQTKAQETLVHTTEPLKIIITVVEAAVLTTVITAEVKAAEMPLQDLLEVALQIKEEEVDKEVAATLTILVPLVAVIGLLEEAVQILTTTTTPAMTGTTVEREIVSITIKEMKRLTDMVEVEETTTTRHLVEVEETNPLLTMVEVALETHLTISRSHHLICNQLAVAVLTPVLPEVALICAVPLVQVVAVVQVLPQVGP